MKQKSSAEEWRRKGNSFFAAKRFDAAIEAYSEGLALGADPLLLSNRAECFLRLGRYSLALEDATEAGMLNPGHAKSHWRRAKALLGLRRFSEALEILLQLTGENRGKPFEDLLQAAKRGDAEARGHFDISSLLREARLSSRLEGHVDYVCRDTCCTWDKDCRRGRCLVAETDIPCGTLIMATKAFAVAFPHEIASLESCELEECSGEGQGEYSKPTQVLLSKYVHMRIQQEPECAVILGELYSGDLNRRNCEDEPLMDRSRIARIVRYNAFSAAVPEGVELEAEEEDDADPERECLATILSGTGLWTQQAVLNHSCTPNCLWYTLGDYMFVHTCRNVTRGEELCHPYAPTLDSHAQRREKLRRFGFECTCARCQYFLSHPKAVEMEFQVSAALEKLLERRDSAQELIESLEHLLQTVRAAEVPRGYTAAALAPLAQLAMATRLLRDYSRNFVANCSAAQLIEDVCGLGTSAAVSIWLQAAYACLKMDRSPYPSIHRAQDNYFAAYGKGTPLGLFHGVFLQKAQLPILPT